LGTGEQRVLFSLADNTGVGNSSGVISMLIYYCMAGSVDPPAPLLLLKLDLDGFSQAESKLTHIQPATLLLLFVMPPLLQVMTYFACSGRSKRIPKIT
jgi:hypothetical protein